MDLNPDKNKVLIIGKSKFNFDYKLQGTAIEIVYHIKDIGVTMQSNLKFTIHCNDMVSKAYFTMRNIFNTFSSLHVAPLGIRSCRTFCSDLAW